MIFKVYSIISRMIKFHSIKCIEIRLEVHDSFFNTVDTFIGDDVNSRQRRNNFNLSSSPKPKRAMKVLLRIIVFPLDFNSNLRKCIRYDQPFFSQWISLTQVKPPFRPKPPNQRERDSKRERETKVERVRERE